MHNSNIEPELNSLVAKLTVEIDNDQNEIEIRTKRIEKNEVLLRAVRASLVAIHPERKTGGYGAKSETIKDAISRIAKSRFTQDDVQSEIRKLNPDLEINRARIRSALWTLAKEQKVIRQVTKGNNRQPSEFEKLVNIVRLRPTGPAKSSVNGDAHNSRSGEYSGMTQTQAILRALEHGAQTTAELLTRLNANGQSFRERTYVTAVLARLKDRVERLPDGKVRLKNQNAVTI